MARPSSGNHLYRVYIPPEVRECIRRHALALGVDRARFERDLLTAWCAWATPWEKFPFNGDGSAFTSMEPFGFPDEPVPGYLERMGFKDGDG